MGILKIKNLIHDYIDEEEDSKFRAIENVSFDVEAGQFITILGHNGSGKSSLAKHINALLMPTEGSVWIDGIETTNEERVLDIRQTAGMVFQNPDNQIVATMVEEDVAFGPENMQVPTAETVSYTHLTSSQRKALIRGQVTSLLNNGKIVTTEARAKEISKVAEGLIALAVKEKDNFDEVEVTAKVARKDKDGKRVKEVVDGKKVTVFDEVKKTIKKDQPSRLHARRQMNKVLYTVTENTGKKKDTKKVDLTNKLFDEIAPKYADRKGGYTRIVKIGQRKGDAAMEVLLELV